MKRDKRWKLLGSTLLSYLIFFLVVSFAVTCCMTLFLNAMSRQMGIEFTAENVGTAAKLTMGNVLLISLLFALSDWFRRKMAVERPVKIIVEAAEKLMQGDFSVRIKPLAKSRTVEGFNTIITCFNRLAEELSGVETLRTDFIANVSHEMKTPLAVMQNYGTLLQAPELSEEDRMAYAKTVTDGSRRLAELMTNILKLNRLENQQIYPQTREYDLSEQICACLLQFENVWERNDIEIETEIAEEVRLKGDEELLSLVWNNLFSNAFKFTEPGGKVTVTLSADAVYATVKVSDTGCGMSPQVGAHIFEKFYQGDTSHATSGNGLGLALVKRIIDITGGEISVSSTLGVGSTFTVRLRRDQRGEV